ncbi:MAG: class II fructose-bisphosphate aldolase [Anaerolineae bacterium]|nr:class II fructose-bisphosphate aldolase [Anaerolineae bacterium]
MTLVNTADLIRAADRDGCALGGFNIYNLEGVRAVVAAAEATRSPVILQIHPAALRHGGRPLVALCLSAAQEASVPAAVHLDHSTELADIQVALEMGIPSVMADGSHLPYADNLAYIRQVTALAATMGASVEAELGRISGTEDGLSVADYEARMTDPDQAAAFVQQTNIDLLAVCIGNVHGVYRQPPRLDFDRLAAIDRAVAIPLVLHGASGLDDALIRQAIRCGVRKFNVNTEVRQAYLDTLKTALVTSPSVDLVPLMQQAQHAMQAVVAEKMALFGSAGRADPITG